MSSFHNINLRASLSISKHIYSTTDMFYSTLQIYFNNTKYNQQIHYDVIS